MAIRDVPNNLPSFATLDEFLSTDELPAGRFVVHIDNVPVDLEYDDRGYDTTVVLLHPALSPKILKLPMFIGRGISAPAPVNRLFIADPTLNMHPKLLLSWFAGNSKQPKLQDSLSRLFKRVTDGKRAMYFGLSGGGFAALTYSSMHPGSIAIPVNPQTNIPDYLPKAVCNWTNSAWGMRNTETADTLKMPPVITNVQKTYAEPVNNYVVYVQNTGDTSHMESHWKPFRDLVNKSNSVTDVLVFSGDGHVAPPEGYLSELLVTIATSRDWGNMDLSGIKASPLRPTAPSGPTPIRDANAKPRTRDSSKHAGSGHHIFNSIDELLSGPIRAGLNSVKFGDSWFDFVYEDNGSTATLVTFSAAASANTTEYPIISGRGIADQLGVNFLGFADPAQGGERALTTYWHLGTEDVDTQSLIPSVIRHSTSSGPGEDLIFFGASAGGFAALNYSSHFDGSVVVAMNPRIHLMHAPYYFSAYTRVAHPSQEPIEVSKSLPVSMADRYRTPPGNRVIYLQNMQDENYVRHHYAHFVKAVGDRDDVRFVKGDWGNGHVVPPKSTYMGVLEAMAINAPNWFGGHDIMCSCNQYRLANLTGASDPHCVAHSTVNYWEEEERSSTH